MQCKYFSRFSFAAQFSADAFLFTMRSKNLQRDTDTPGTRRSFQRDTRETCICPILISSPSFLSDLLIPLIPRPLISRSHRRSRSRNNNARRNRARGGSIEESRKRECNVIRTVHCRMMGLYVDIGRVREGSARGWSNEAGRQEGAPPPASHRPPAHPAAPRLHIAQQSRGMRKH